MFSKLNTCRRRINYKNRKNNFFFVLVFTGEKMAVPPGRQAAHSWSWFPIRDKLPRMRGTLILILLSALLLPLNTSSAATPDSLFARDNLVAWCIVPFDAAKRNPRQRSEMLDRLGLSRVAYDWRDNHIPEWDDELRQYQSHKIELTAFWAPTRHGEILDLLKRHNVRAQLWTDHNPKGETDGERIANSVAHFAPLAALAKTADCTVGLYNHGGWFGHPRNLITIVEQLKAKGHSNVGIVYNLHHAHDDLADFAANLKLMKPHLLCLNLNGMKAGGPKILPLGQGDDDLSLLRTIRDSGYAGPLGILNHREELDAETGLKQNLDGLKQLLHRLGDADALKSYNDSAAQR
jgi:sugar phosphate isomerase/epimerase